MTTPAHQPLTSIIIIFWQRFGGLIRSFWPVLIYFIISGKSGTNWPLIIGSIGLAMMSFVGGLIRYWYFVYYVDAKHLIVMSGAITKKQQQIPFDRIQSIRFEQTWLHQLIALYAVHVDTAGSSDTEIVIPALTLAEAEALKGYIEQRADFDQTTRQAESSQQEHTPMHTLVALRLVDLMKLGLTANHIRTFFVVFGLGIGLLTQLGEFIPDYRLDRVIGDAIDGAERVQFDLMYLLAIPVLVVVTLLISIGLQTVKFYGMRLQQSSTGYHVRYGLFNRREQIAPFGKIQLVMWSITPLRRLLKLYQVRIRQAVSGRIDEKSTMRVAGATMDDIASIRGQLFHEMSSWTTIPIEATQMATRYFLYFILTPSVIAAAVATWQQVDVALPIIAIIVGLASWGLYRHERSWHIQVNDDYLYVTHGTFGQIWYQLYLRKLQGGTLRQTPYQVRHELADVVLQSAAGSVRLPYLKLDDARALLDMVLYRVEVDQRDWM